MPSAVEEQQQDKGSQQKATEHLLTNDFHG
jgi:hypothetical protein